jgi:hypothetical protein
VFELLYHSVAGTIGAMCSNRKITGHRGANLLALPPRRNNAEAQNWDST